MGDAPPRVVAIDGPAGAGKSTVARVVAAHLGLPVLDTGAMYRAITFAVLRAGVDATDAEAVAALAAGVHVELGEEVVVDGVDATAAIRGPEVTAAVSHVAKVPAVRALLLVQQRDWVAERGGAVVEGRDIGTVVFPDAPVKVYLTADPAVRAARRHAEEAAAARATTVDRVHDDLLARDRIDSGRETAPLERAADALDLDTTSLSVDEAVARVLAAWTAATGERA